jgi:hypothetical protein
MLRDVRWQTWKRAIFGDASAHTFPETQAEVVTNGESSNE